MLWCIYVSSLRLNYLIFHCRKHLSPRLSVATPCRFQVFQEPFINLVTAALKVSSLLKADTVTGRFLFLLAPMSRHRLWEPILFASIFPIFICSHYFAVLCIQHSYEEILVPPCSWEHLFQIC